MSSPPSASNSSRASSISSVVPAGGVGDATWLTEKVRKQYQKEEEDTAEPMAPKDVRPSGYKPNCRGTHGTGQSCSQCEANQQVVEEQAKSKPRWLRLQ